MLGRFNGQVVLDAIELTTYPFLGEGYKVLVFNQPGAFDLRLDPGPTAVPASRFPDKTFGRIYHFD